MLDAYFRAFEHFLKTGNTDALAGFIDTRTDVTRLRVYRNGYLKTSTDALAASYPVVRSLVGEACFRSLAHAYLEVFPPKAGTLVGYGDHFPEFLRTRSHEHGLDYLADAAIIDAAWLASYFAEAVEALSATAIESISAAGTDVSALRVRLTPAAQLVHLTHRIVETWVLIREQGALDSTVHLSKEDQVALVWRLGHRIHIRALDPGEAAFVSTLAGVATLEEAATRALEADESFDLALTFAALLENNILQLEDPIE